MVRLDGWQIVVNDRELNKVVLRDQLSTSEIISEMTYQYAVMKDLLRDVA